MAQPLSDLETLREWIGRSEVDTDTAAEAPAKLLAATLDRENAPRPGDELPCLWHWLYFLPATRRSDLGEDGLPKRGAFMPPVALPRRMWAGSRIEFRQPIRIGENLRRRATIADVVGKTGRAGPLVFVRVRYEIESSHGVAILEERDVVFRDVATGAAAESPEATDSPQWQESVVADPVLLFRYSALTFNAHRIHYDALYVTAVERYPGLVVRVLSLPRCSQNSPAREFPIARFDNCPSARSVHSSQQQHSRSRDGAKVTVSNSGRRTHGTGSQ
jgi:3-methylfumaryl-CoA hydratase